MRAHTASVIIAAATAVFFTGAGSKGEGTWQLSKDGFCTTWSGTKANCFTIVAAGDNKWSVLKGSTIMATWSK